MADHIEHPDEERDVAELDALLDELVSEARDIERYTQWDRHARAEAESRADVDETLAKIRATLATLRAQLTEAQADRDLVDWVESVYVGGDELFIDRCELEPDGGGPLFIGFTIHRGKKDDGGNFVSGAETLRAALTAARLASSSEKPNG